MARTKASSRGKAATATAMSTSQSSSTMASSSSSSVDMRACPHCPARVAKEDMKRHLIKEHKHVSLDCQYCGKHFKMRHHLRQHITSVHLGERYFKCGMCDFRATQPSVLKTHERTIHLKLKLFVCVYCDAFSTNNVPSIKNHLVKRHEVQPEDIKMATKKCRVSFAKPKKEGEDDETMSDGKLAVGDKSVDEHHANELKEKDKSEGGNGDYSESSKSKKRRSAEKKKKKHKPINNDNFNEPNEGSETKVQEESSVINEPLNIPASTSVTTNLTHADDNCRRVKSSNSECKDDRVDESEGTCTVEKGKKALWSPSVGLDEREAQLSPSALKSKSPKRVNEMASHLLPTVPDSGVKVPLLSLQTRTKKGGKDRGYKSLSNGALKSSEELPLHRLLTYRCNRCSYHCNDCDLFLEHIKQTHLLASTQ